MAQQLVQVGHCKALGFIDLDGDPLEPNTVKAVSAVGKYFDVKFVSPQLVPTTETDYGPAVATLQSEGADCVIDGFNSSQLTQPLVTAIGQADSITAYCHDRHRCPNHRHRSDGLDGERDSRRAKCP